MRKGLNMKDFWIYAPTKIVFGETCLDSLVSEVKRFGNRLMLVYGGGSIKKTGLYDNVMGKLREGGIFVVEYSGVSPNPKVSHIRKGIEIARENKIDMVLAVGGGSAIDEAKGIAGGYYLDEDVWDHAVRMNKAGLPIEHRILPVLTILTLAATGTEMATGCNWTNDTIDPQVKLGFHGPELRPKVSFLDPRNTYTVSRFQTAAGSADILSHIFESYFSNVKTAYMHARVAEALMKTVIKYAPIALEDPENYEARANLMYASSWGNNGYIVKGNQVNWSVHILEHELTAFNDTTHGDGLSILTPVWMRWVVEDESKVYRFVDLGVNVFGIDPSLPDKEIALKAIDCVEDFFWNTLGLHRHMREVGITKENIELFTNQVEKKLGYLAGSYKPMTKDDIRNLYLSAL